MSNDCFLNIYGHFPPTSVSADDFRAALFYSIQGDSLLAQLGKPGMVFRFRRLAQKLYERGHHLFSLAWLCNLRDFQGTTMILQ